MIVFVIIIIKPQKSSLVDQPSIRTFYHNYYYLGIYLCTFCLSYSEIQTISKSHKM